VTQPLIAEVANLTAQVKTLHDEIAIRDSQIEALQREQRAEKQRTRAQIALLEERNETLTTNIDKMGKCDIGQAAKRGDIDLVSLWISVGCDVNKRDHECVHAIFVRINGHRMIYRQWTPLHWASSSGRSDIADLLIRNGADVHAKDDE
jgi:ankyrin repeat protein